MDRPELTRQFDLIPLGALATPVTIIGAGAIGSNVALWLAKMGMTDITVWDPDSVAIENVNCQLYGPDDVGRTKVDALAAIVARLSTGKILPVPEKWTKGDSLAGIVIAAADCMTVRREIFEACTVNLKVRAFIDTRMGAEQALMYVMDPHSPKDQASYKKTIYSNSEANPAPCTAKATGYTASLLSAWAVKAVKDLITGGNYPRITQWNVFESHQQVFRKDNPQ